MECEECKFWRPVGKTDVDGKWTQNKSDRGKRLGWCLRSRPHRNEKTSRGDWPDTEYDDNCGEFEPKVTALERLRRENLEYYCHLASATRNWRYEKRKSKTIIKAVKVKYPKIRLNNKAFEKAVEIIQRHKPE